MPLMLANPATPDRTWLLQLLVAVSAAAVLGGLLWRSWWRRLPLGPPIRPPAPELEVTPATGGEETSVYHDTRVACVVFMMGSAFAAYAPFAIWRVSIGAERLVHFSVWAIGVPLFFAIEH